ncbi:MAG: peptide chain release factor 1 [Verrucomicrobia bacterium]|nr:peptide chain release factor 1 [Verrucomicrobiota bacterium]
MDFEPLIDQKRGRFYELEKEVASSSLFDNPRRAREVLREHAGLKVLLENWDRLEKSVRELEENREMATGSDVEFAELAQAEIPLLEDRVGQLSRAIQYALLPPEPHEDRDAIMEIRAGTGGNEAGLFAADLYRMYSKYAEAHRFKIEELEGSISELGGFKEIIFKVSGVSVFRALRYESGVHRVQRVPLTEAQGRIHTSTATVAVLPEAEEVDIEIRPEDLRIEVSRAGGPGGQGVNTTDSAVQVLHIPTGKIVRCQDGRSQQKNKEKALAILRSRLLEEKQLEEAEKYSAHRRSLIGSGGREEKIRTYNFPQNRVTDHRIGLTLYNLDLFMEGQLDEMVNALQASDIEQRLKEAGLNAVVGASVSGAGNDPNRAG